MELYEQIVTGAVLVFTPIFFVFIAILVVVKAVRGTDLRDLDAMRTTNPRLFRQMVFVLRFNGAMCVGLGAFICVVGFVVAISTAGTLVGLASLPIGAGITWIAFRWCRWAWQTKLD